MTHSVAFTLHGTCVVIDDILQGTMNPLNKTTISGGVEVSQEESESIATMPQPTASTRPSPSSDFRAIV